MHLLRARFKREILCEFLPPTRKSSRIIILAAGMPSVPSKKETLLFLAKKGYWVFFPRYRGTWESSGHFLSISPHKDILDIIDQLPRGFKELWSGKQYKIHPSKIYIVGSSFGGPAAIFASRDKRVTKVFTFSPVIDWRKDSKAEPLDWLYGFTREAFGNGYRMSKSSWNKLKGGRFYNPAYYAKQIDGKKIFIVHAKDDKIVPWQPTKKFARDTGAKLLLLKKGDHLSGSNIIKPRFWKHFQKHIRS